MIITVDTGGTKTLISSFDNNGLPGERFRFPTPTDSEEYIQILIETLRKNYDGSQVDAISIAVPGVVRDNILSWCGNLPWENFAIASMLAPHYSCPIWLQNDADLAGLAEANALNKLPSLCLYVTISTGIGSGILINGRLTPELSGSEAGSMMIEYDGRVRPWESFASGKAIHAAYGKYAYEINDKKTWNRIADRFARGFSALIPPLQPDVIVIGGSIGSHFDRYKQPLNLLLEESLPRHIMRPKIVQASHPQEAVIYGCYYYAVHQLAN